MNDACRTSVIIVSDVNNDNDGSAQEDVSSHVQQPQSEVRNIIESSDHGGSQRVKWVLHFFVYALSIGVFVVLPWMKLGLVTPIYFSIVSAHVHIFCAAGVPHLWQLWLIGSYCLYICGVVLHQVNLLDSGACVGLFGLVYSCEMVVRTYITGTSETLMWNSVRAIVAIVKALGVYSTVLVAVILLSSPER
eukprot:PhF_6_TR9139/c0_g1_i1/m.14212